MPLFKGKSSKALPNRGIKYICREDKAIYISSINLDDNRDYAEQFKETSDIFHKNLNKGDRKYYHFKLSADPKDKLSPEQHQRFAEELASRLFSNYECVITTHIDTDVVHSHIIINSIDFETGKKARFGPREYLDMKRLANEVGLSYDCTPLDFTRRSKINITQAEKHIELKGGISWKQELREVLDLAMMKTSSLEEFESYINKYGVTITKNTGNTISFKHPMKNKSIRGIRLGQKYMRKEILYELEKSGDKLISLRRTQNECSENRIGKAERYSKTGLERTGDGIESTSENIHRKRRDIHDTIPNVSRETDFELEGTDSGSTNSGQEVNSFDTGFSGHSL